VVAIACLPCAAQDSPVGEPVEKGLLVAHDVRDGVGQAQRAADGEDDGVRFSEENAEKKIL
jgi:hypothetical protein